MPTSPSSSTQSRLRDAGRAGLAGLALIAAMAGEAPARPASALILYAWERPEDLRFAGPDQEVAALVGTLELAGDALRLRERRGMLLTLPGVRRTAVVRVRIDPRQPLQWTPALRRSAVETIVRQALWAEPQAVQIDFSVGPGQRSVLLDVLGDVRRALGGRTQLSMTAPAAWCDQAWLDRAPVDEIVPLLFGGEPGEAPLRARLAAGGDFRNPRCRSALAVSVDRPLGRGPAGRRVYVYNPLSWTETDLGQARRVVQDWGTPDLETPDWATPDWGGRIA